MLGKGNGPTTKSLVESNTGRFGRKIDQWGAWVVQSVERPISAQVMISQLVGSRPVSGSVLRAWSLEPALDSVSPSLSTPNPLTLCLCLSQK